MKKVDKKTGEIFRDEAIAVTPATYNPYDVVVFEEVSSDSETVPDMSMGIQEILENHTRGLAVPGAVGNPTYDDSDFDFSKLDRMEREEYLLETREQVAYLKNQLKRNEEAHKRRIEEEKAQKADEKVSSSNAPTEQSAASNE